MKHKKTLIHIGLFLLTVATTTIAGAEWMFGRFLFWGEQKASWEDLIQALQFSGPFLFVSVRDCLLFAAVEMKLQIS